MRSHTPEVFHLLITKTPNLFAQRGRESTTRLSFLSVDGSRGLATAALRLLFAFDYRELLYKINQRIEGCQLFQIALDVEIPPLEEDGGQVHAARSVRLAERMVDPIHSIERVPNQLVEEACRYVVSRLPAEGIRRIG